MRAFLLILKKAAMDWVDDNATTHGAALAYYAIFSLAPLFMISIAIAGFIFGEEAARGQIVEQLEWLTGQQGAEAIQSVLNSVNKPGTGLPVTVVGIVAMLFGASGVFVSLQTSLNMIWGLAPAKGMGIVDFIRRRALTFAMTLGVGGVLLASLLLTTILAGAEKFFSEHVPAFFIVNQAINFVTSFGLITLMFAVVFKWLPDARIAWRDVWVGAAITSLLFMLGKYAIGLYLGRTAVATAFGAAGSLIAMLLWVYYSSQILFFGAEITHAYATIAGSRRSFPEHRAKLEEEQKRLRQPVGAETEEPDKETPG